MIKTRKKTLTVLIITAILLLCFAISMIWQSSGKANADTLDNATDIQSKLSSVASNGNVPVKSTEGTAIGNADQLRAFLESGRGKGYLTTNIDNFSWDNGKFTRRLMSENVTELNGNGYRITLTATQLADSSSGAPALGVDDHDYGETPYTVALTHFNDKAVNTYAGTKDARKNLDVHAGLIGYLRPNQTIKNCNFEYNQTFNLSYQTHNCATFGLIVGYSLGTIDNCSLTISKNISLFKDTSWTGSVTSYAQETMSKHSAAMGGFVGTMSTNARVSNSKITLYGNMALTVQGRNGGSNSYRSNYARAWTGGIVGWMANASQVFNIVTEGYGNVDARCVNPQGNRTRSFAGIVAGVSGGDGVLAQDSLIGKIETYGTINGVINNWFGSAKYLTEDAQYSPVGGREVSIPRQIVGVAGLQGNGNQSVGDIFVGESVYSGSTFSIGFDYSVTAGTNGTNRGRYLSTEVLVQDVLGKDDGSENYKAADAKNTYLAFSGTQETAPLWAVYDIQNEACVLWAKTVTRGNASPEVEYYYDKVKSIEEAKKYDVTYTEITRGQNQKYEIKYLHGKAVYFNKSYPIDADTTDPNNVIMPTVRYGEGLSVPALNLYYNKADMDSNKQPFSVLTDKSYWVSISDSNNVPIRMSDNVKVEPDTYQSFLYLDNPVGRDYSYIQFINPTLRYISYIYDDPNYQAYKVAHPDYEPVKNGEKQIDWQQRAVQTVLPKLADIEWGFGSDIKKVGGIKYDGLNNITTYGQFKTTYDGDPVVFNLSINGLLSGDTCSPNYEYRQYDSYTGEYNKVDSCVNAGTYKLVVTSLSNRNYGLAGAGTVDYCIDFEIEQREIGFINKIPAEEIDDAYHIKVTYAARDITLAEEIDICPDKTQADSSLRNIVLYNVLKKDKSILKFDYVAYGEGELNMRNVGKFEMRMSLLGGINSGNYKMPKVTKYVVEIIEAEPVLSTQTRFEYPYGFFVSDKVDPFVTVKGVDGTLLDFGEFTYYKKVNGVFEPMLSGEEPFDAGEYQIKYDFLNSWYTNYEDASITVDVTIKPRNVKATYTDDNNQYKEVAYGTSVSGVAVKFDRQTGENGIIAYEYSSASPVFRFNKLENGFPTDIWVDKAVDAGEYLIEVGLDFTTGTTSSGWQINENTKKNYNVQYDRYSVIITKKEVNIRFKDVQKAYGDDLPEFIGDANAVDEVRAWDYVSSEDFFFPGDNIVIMPYLSNDDVFAKVEIYDLMTSHDKAYMSDKAHLDDADLDTYNKIDNYIVNVVDANGNILDVDNEKECAKYEVVPRQVKVKIILNTSSVVYGDALPECVEIRVVGSNDFFLQDRILLTPVWQDEEGNEVVQGSGVGKYFVSAYIGAQFNDIDKNYKLECEDAQFSITPMTLTIIKARVEGETEFTFDGNIHKPTVIPVFAEDIGGEVVEFNFNYFEIVDGETSTVATENPSYAGQYRVYIADSSNPNYRVVFGEDYTRGNVVMTINKRNVKIDVLPAYRIYSVEGSLTPIMRGEIHEEPGWHYYTKEEAEAIYGDNFYTPYKYASDSQHQFVQNNEQLRASMYIDEYYSTLGVKRNVVKLVFDGLVPDANAIDEDGNWITKTVIGENGEEIQIIAPAYRNYNIEMNLGDLHILGSDLSKVERYVSLKSTEQVYNGNDRFDDFRVLTSNDNIAKALKFEIFKYVAVSSLSKSESDALANAHGEHGGRYTQAEVDGQLVYEKDDENGTYVRKYFRRIEYGDAVSDKIVDAGQYFMLITPADKDAKIFEGYLDTISFTITKAVREVSASDISVSINYDKITLSSKIEGMEISFNGAAYTKRNTFVDLTANTDYVVKVRFAETGNYLMSDEITLNLHTGIDITAIQNTLAKFDKIDFSNIEEYESKVLAFINSVSPEDMARLDLAKYAKLQASYVQLIRGANSVIAGAQKAGATAVGKSGKTSSSVKTVALSMSGVSIAVAGLMFFAKKKKEDSQEEVKSVKKVNVKRASKMLVAVIAVALVCVTLFAGCVPSDNGEFSKADLYRIASFQADDGAQGKRDLTIEVSSSGVTLYKYANGQETVNDRLDVDSIKLDKDGIGFEFDDLYFKNSQFVVDETLATFTADVRETLVFFGVNNASNGKVKVVVDTASGRLNTIDASYDVISGGITYNVTIGVRVKY